MATTWTQKLDELRRKLGREPSLEEVLQLSASHKMTPEEIQAQRESWARANISTGDPRFD